MIRLYTIEHCPYCNELKEKFNSDGIKYVEVDVDKEENKIEFDKLYEVTKCYDVPMVRVGNQILVPHTSFKSIDECYRLTKKFLV